MAPKQKPFRTQLRGNIWYWKPAGGVWKSTDLSSDDFTKKQIDSHVEARIRTGRSALLFEDFTRGFFAPDGAWANRQRSKGHKISDYWIEQKHRQLESHILPTFRGKLLTEINSVMIEDWISGLALSSQSKKHILYTMKTIVREAFRSRLIPEDPFRLVEKFAVHHREREVYTLEELQKLFPVGDMAALLRIWNNQCLATLAFTVLSCGLRSGEGRALQWRDLFEYLDPAGAKRHGLVIERSVKGGDSGIGPTKTGIARAVPLSAGAFALLTTWQTRAPWVDSEDLMFSYKRKKYLVTSVLNHALVRACVRAKVDRRGRDVHCLRHTYRTEAAKMIPEAALNSILGHSGAVGRRYDHTLPRDRLQGFAIAPPEFSQSL
jgi:integrase